MKLALEPGRISKSSRPVIFLLLTVGTLSMAVILILVVSTIRQEIKETQSEFRSEVLWWASQTDHELLVLINKLWRRHSLPETISRDDLIDGLDIFWGRIEGAGKGSVGRVFMALPSAEANLAKIRAALERIEPMISGFQPGNDTAYLAIRQELDRLSKLTHPLAMEALRQRHLEIATRTERLGQVLWQVILIFALVLLSGAALVAMIVMEKTKAQRLRDELEIRVEERTRELKRSNEELEQFAYIASHDLQEPLRKISGFCGLLEPKLEGRLDEEEKEFFGYLTDAAKRMQHLIRDLLTLSRLGSREVKREPIDCTEMLATVLEDSAMAIDGSEAKIAYRDLPQILGDRDQITQLFANLINNSVKYRSAEPPEIVITAERIDEAVRFSVRDNGLGFESKFAERIFRTFQRLHTREDYEGTGIGLAICKKVVERHGGQIWADSAPGEGSTFWFTVPAA